MHRPADPNGPSLAEHGARAEPRPLLSQHATGLIGGALVTLGPLSMVLYTPAMPTLVEAFATTDAMVKLTLSVYFAGFAATQLIIGPLSDAFGRRPVLLAFLVLYAVATTAAMLAPSVEWMLAARLGQGLCAAVGVVIARAIVRDQYVGQTSSRIMNVIIMLLALSPALAPLIGGVTLELAGWRAIFLVMNAYGVALMGLVLLVLPETNRYRDISRLRPGRLAASYLTLLTDARFLRPSLVLGSTVGCVFVFASVLPFVMIDRVGLTPTQYGLVMLVQGGALLLGTVAVSRLLRRVAADRLVPWGLAIMIASGTALGVLTQTAELTVVSVIVPIAVMTVGIAFVTPAMMTAAVANFPEMAGAASAMMGFMQMGGGLVGSAVAAALADPVVALVAVLPAMPLVATAAYVGLKGRAEAPRAPTATMPPAA